MMPVLAPLVDLVFLGIIADFLLSGLDYQRIADFEGKMAILFAYLALPLSDLLRAVLAFSLEPGKVKWRLLLLLPFQRALYQPLLYFTTIRALYRAVMGGLARWSKIRRLGLKPTETKSL
jgi:hypothetical protein